MLSNIKTYGILGIKSFQIDVETNISRGIPEFDIVGQGDVSIKESRVRVRTAIINSDYKFPDGKIAVNLAPAALRKEGTFLDLPIAVGILCASGDIKCKCIDRCAIIGELSLSGEVRPVEGMLIRLSQAVLDGAMHAIVPYENADEAVLVKECNIYPVKDLTETVSVLNSLTLDSKGISMGRVCCDGSFDESSSGIDLNISDNIEDFSDVKGQYQARRAMEIAACGGHNILLAGAPGCGKTMLGRRFAGILPPLTDSEAYEVTGVYSLARLLPNNKGLMRIRPLRIISPGITKIALIGGGRPLMPGEISLAHNGVLFMDEMTEYESSFIQLLRQPLERRSLLVSRLGHAQCLPTDFIFVGAANPCKCGRYFEGECTCTPNQVRATLSRISKPILDRIDLHVPMKRISYDDIESQDSCECSSIIRQRVIQVRAYQLERYKGKGLTLNAHLTGADINTYCALDKECRKLLRKATDTMRFSARGYNKIIKIARTIADMEFSDSISVDHVAEAISYRAFDSLFTEEK
ncbi:MAG: ATP-binding protein [Ruminococcaceae bacterium]|nr:ATP-binding protein [Oscillospiraceae bacterium]